MKAKESGFFIEISPNLILPDIFSLLVWVIDFWDWYYRTEVPFPSHYEKGYVILTWTLTGDTSPNDMMKGISEVSPMQTLSSFYQL